MNVEDEAIFHEHFVQGSNLILVIRIYRWPEGDLSRVFNRVTHISADSSLHEPFARQVLYRYN